MSDKNNRVNELTYETNLICQDNCYKEANLHQWGPGVREVYVLHYIISGKGFLEMNQKVHEINAGDVFLIFPDTEVYYYPSKEDPWEYIWVDFSGEEAYQFVSMTSFTKEEPVVRGRMELKPYFYIFDEERNPIIRRERYKAKLQVLLTYFYSNIEDERKPKENEYIAMAMEYINNNYWKSSFNVTSIVKYLNIDRTYLFRLFKKTTGISMIQFIMEYRINKACKLLLKTELSIKSIAYSVGFDDPLHFSRVFHKKMQMSPSSYRKSVQLPLSR